MPAWYKPQKGIRTVFFFFFFMILLLSAVSAATTRTSSTETECAGDYCTMSIYSGVRFVQEDDVWKPVEEARSLVGSDIVCSVIEDSDTSAYCSDYNLTSITIKTKLKNDAKKGTDIAITIKAKDGHEKYKTKVKYKDTTEEKTFKISYAWGDEIHIGNASTTIRLNESNSNVIDAHFRQSNPDNNYDDSELDFQIPVGTGYQFVIQFDNLVPAGNTVTDAKIYFTNAQNLDSTGTNGYLTPYLIDTRADTWTEGGVTWNLRPTTILAVGVGTYFTKDNPGVNVQFSINATTPVALAQSLELNNISLYFNISNANGAQQGLVYSSETGTAAYRPQLDVTYMVVNAAPTLTGQAPANTTRQAYSSLHRLNATYNDADSDAGNVTFVDNSDDSVLCTNVSLAAGGEASCTLTSAEIGSSLQLEWCVNATDGTDGVTTCTAPYLLYVNNVTLSTLNAPANQTVIDTNGTAVLNVTLDDGDADYLNVTFLNSSYGTICSFTNQTSTATLNCTATVSRGAQVDWYINITDGYDAQLYSYTFNTTANNIPVIVLNAPANGSEIVTSGSAVLNVTVTDADLELFNATFLNSSLASVCAFSGQSNGTTLNCTLSNVVNGTQVYWYLNITDGFTPQLLNYSFSSTATPNRAPTATLISPTNGSSINVSATLTASLNITVFDGDNETLNVSFLNSTYGLFCAYTGQSNGTSLNCTISALNGVTIGWYANITDGTDSQLYSYTFSTLSNATINDTTTTTTTTAASTTMLAVIAVAIALSLIIFGIGLYKEDENMIGFSSMLGMAIGVFILINGIDDYNNLVTLAMGIVIIGFCAYAFLRVYMEKIVTSFNEIEDW